MAVLHRKNLDEIAQTEAANAEQLSSAIASSEELLVSLGRKIPEEGQFSNRTRLRPAIVPRTWGEILAEATATVPENVEFTSLLTQEEIDSILDKHSGIGSELGWLTSLDRYDLALSVATGVIAGVVDVLLVGVPAHAGFMGSPKAK